VFERYGNEIFRCGSCCINGYRENMEDAHVTVLRPTWGFFGVFDGHVNAKCSEFLEHSWKKILEADPPPVPMSDERMKEIALAIDEDGREAGHGCSVNKS
jgi:protein phosphatase